MILYNLPLPPTGTNNAYHTNKGRWYKDKKIVVWEEECLWFLKKKVNKGSYKTNLCVNIGFYFSDKRKHDIDGKIKPVLDLFEKAGAYSNDSEVTDLIVAKRYDKEKPRLEVQIYGS